MKYILFVLLFSTGSMFAAAGGSESDRFQVFLTGIGGSAYLDKSCDVTVYPVTFQPGVGHVVGESLAVKQDSPGAGGVCRLDYPISLGLSETQTVLAVISIPGKEKLRRHYKWLYVSCSGLNPVRGRSVTLREIGSQTILDPSSVLQKAHGSDYGEIAPGECNYVYLDLLKKDGLILGVEKDLARSHYCLSGAVSDGEEYYFPSEEEGDGDE